MLPQNKQKNARNASVDCGQLCEILRDKSKQGTRNNPRDYCYSRAGQNVFKRKRFCAREFINERGENEKQKQRRKAAYNCKKKFGAFGKNERPNLPPENQQREHNNNRGGK